MPRQPDQPCSRCGKLLWRGTTSAAVQTCRDCRRLIPPKRDRSNQKTLGATYPCKVCGTPFVKDHGRKVTCSLECQKLACDPVIDVRCSWCDKPMRQTVRSADKGRRPSCSDSCVGAIAAYSLGRTIASPWSPPKPPRVVKPKPEPFIPEDRECAWCGDAFIARQPSHVYCAKEHKAKAGLVRRTGRRLGWDSHFTLAELMRVFLAFDRCCAYCGQPIDGLPQPDHVVPLSRGGPNSITNILPVDGMCNSDKRDLLLSEWNADRDRRGLEPRVVSWAATDKRFGHLTFLGNSSAA